MKKLLLFLIQVIAFSIFCKAQTPGWGWAYGGGGASYQYPNGLAVDDSDYIYIGGRFAGTLTFNNVSTTDGGYGNILYLGKFDTSGNGLWLTNYLFSNDEDYPQALCIDYGKNNHVYDCGIPASGDIGSYVVKYSSGGTLLWNPPPTLGSGDFYGQNPEPHGIAADTAGDVYVTGETGGGAWTLGDSTLDFAGSDLQEMYLAKMDKGGNYLWAVGMDGVDAADDGYDVGRAVAIDYTAQYVYVVGSYTGTPSFHSRNPLQDVTGPASQTGEPYANMFVAKYDTAGNLIWVSYGINAGIPDNPSDIPWSQDVGGNYAVALDSCDNVFVTGFYNGTATFGSLPSITSANGYNSGFVATCNSKGEWQWLQNVVNPNDNTYSSCIAIDKDNDVYVQGTLFAGTTNFGDGITATSSQEETYVAKYANSTGDVQWVLNATSVSGGTSSAGGIGVDKQKFVYLTGAYTGSVTFGTHTLPNLTSFELYIAKIDTIPARYIVPIVDSTYCPGEATNLVYNVVGSFNNGNVFTAELSNDSGSFVDYTIIGTVTSTTSGTISITIPPGTPPGSNYLIRVVSSNPATSSYVNGCGAYYQNNVYINDFYITIGAGGNIPAKFAANPGFTICSGTSDTITVSGGSTYLWGSPVTSSNNVIVVSPTTTTTYNVQITEGACTLDTSVVITVGTSTLLNITPQSPSTCVGGSVTLNAPAGSTYTWSPATGLSATTGLSVTASPTIMTVYTVNGPGSGGCTSSGTDTVFIGPTPPFYILPPEASTCIGQPTPLTVSDTLGKDYVWTPLIALNPDTGITVNVSPTIQTTYTVTGMDSIGCTVIAMDTVSVIAGSNPPIISLSNNIVLTSTASEGNQWYKDGNMINDATNKTLTISDTGCYYVIATNPANGCTSISNTLCVTSLAGINQLSINPDQLSIYPNPTDGEIFINISSSVADVKDWNLQITDVLGRTVYSRMSLNYSNDVDLSNLASGVYFITIINNTARVVFPVVKQN